MPFETVERLVKSRNANCGVFYLRQISLATLDQNIHTNGDVNPTQVCFDRCDQIMYQQVSEVFSSQRLLRITFCKHSSTVLAYALNQTCLLVIYLFAFS